MQSLYRTRETENNLGEIVAKVRQNFKWYDNFVGKTEYDKHPTIFNLPYVDGTILDEFYYSMKDDSVPYDHVYFTSGTTKGTKKRILYSEREHSLYLEHRKKIFSKFITADCKKVCSDLGTGHAADSSVSIFQNLGLEVVKINPAQPINEHVEILNRINPDVFFTMPMILDKIISTKQIHFNPKKIIILGDVATENWKNHVAKFFDIKRSDVMDILGSIEVGSIAYECHKCGLYHFEGHIIPETIKVERLYPDRQTNLSAEILVLTSTARNLFPALRFITNDLIQGFCIHNCEGKNTFSFSKILGRIGGEFKHGEKITLYDITEAINSHLPGALFDVYSHVGECVIKLYSAEFQAGVGEKIVEHIKKLNPDIDEMIQSGILEDIKIIQASQNDLNCKKNKRIFM